jgi:hypothetical protein
MDESRIGSDHFMILRLHRKSHHIRARHQWEARLLTWACLINLSRQIHKHIQEQSA